MNKCGCLKVLMIAVVHGLFGRDFSTLLRQAYTVIPGIRHHPQELHVRKSIVPRIFNDMLQRKPCMLAISAEVLLESVLRYRFGTHASFLSLVW